MIIVIIAIACMALNGNASSLLISYFPNMFNDMTYSNTSPDEDIFMKRIVVGETEEKELPVMIVHSHTR